ncbi:MAG: host-nuclease inhibitor Gam family protein [Syntrophobacter sp.]
MCTVENWNDVDRMLEEIGRLDLAISDISSALGRKLHGLIGEFSREISEISGQRHALESALQLFCLSNKSEFGKKRSRKFHYGRIAFKLAERIEVPEELQDSVIATLKKLGLKDCIETRERLDRNALKRLPDSELARCGIKRIREDHFRIEPDINLISEKIGRKDLVSPSFLLDVEKLSKIVKTNNTEAERAPQVE